MPTYDYTCETCGTFEAFHWMRESVDRCPQCGGVVLKGISLPQMIIKDNNWSHENGGRGRYSHQLAEYRGDPRAYAKSVDDLSEKAKRRGYSVSKFT